ncbi:succinate dehydrogenase subunit 5, mitochondrial [Ipomoea triloba]|uniref:succinate dehydrogenase subunit 5, mitochondrial n=1 Tax=Ipomoea triloba TaxID=35885 RepID=UPI00125E2F7D|nr:succinate dehydrogenase subunit 5, mitochondrial [Ipomoea triloba]
MEKMMLMRSLCRCFHRRSSVFSSYPAALAATATVNHQAFRHLHISPPSFVASPKSVNPECLHPFSLGLGSVRSFSEDVAHMPDVKDEEIRCAFKDLMAASWDEIPEAVIDETKKALSKSTDDKAGQEALANVFRAAEAIEEFIGILTNLKMAIDDSIGLSGENVKPMPKHMANALDTIFQRYNTYLNSFGPEEGYLKKKVETELGSRMIFLKMRCSGLNSDWGKVTVLGTSGLAGSYVEQRA